MRCQTLPTADPILKNSAFDLMTDLRLWLPRHQFKGSFFNDSSELRDSTTTCSGLVPGISLSQTRRTLGERVDGRDKPGHDVLGFPAMHTNFSIRTLAGLPSRCRTVLAERRVPAREVP